MDPAPLEQPEPHLKALTGLRFLAASMIVAFHAVPLFHLDNRHFLSHLALPQGVTLFFVLSGFILTYTHSRLKGLIQSFQFISMRLARIWPTHLVCAMLALFLLVCVWKQPVRFTDFILNIFLLHSLSAKNSCFFYLNNVSWSISTEFFFYLLFPILIRLGRKNIWAPFLCCSMITVCGLFIACGQHDFYVPDGRWFGWSYINPITRLSEFGLGITTALLFLKFASGFNAQQSMYSSCVEVLAFGGCCFSVAVMPSMPLDAFFPHILPPFSFYWQESAGAVFYAFLIFCLALGRGVVSNLLSNRLLIWLGEISFAIYMIHHLVINLFSELGLLRSSSPRVGLFICYLLVVMTVSTMLHYLVEQPCRKRWNNILKHRRLRFARLEA